MSTLRVPVGPHDHVDGPAGAPVTMVEYGDYQCPYCGEAYGVVKQLLARDRDRIRFVFRNFPLPEVHPQAVPAATVAEYAATEGKFWTVHDALYEHQDQLGMPLYAAIANRFSLDLDGLRRALQADEFAGRIQEDVNSGLRSGVNGTPGFFVNGQLYNVQGGFADLATPIDQILAT